MAMVQTNNYKSDGRTMEQIMLKLGYTNDDMARLTGLSTSTIARTRRGVNTNKVFGSAIANVLGVDFKTLFAKEGNEQKECKEEKVVRNFGETANGMLLDQMYDIRKLVSTNTEALTADEMKCYTQLLIALQKAIGGSDDEQR